jgi:branched-chain amino acid transport system permease protein
LYALTEYVVRGVLAGSIYGLLALPMSLLFATVRSIDFAVGAYALLAAAVATSVAGPLGIVAGIAAAVAAAAAMGLIFLILKRLGCEDHIIFALASFGLAVAIASLILWHYGTQAFVRASFSQFWSLGGIRISPQGVINLGLGSLVVALLYVTLYRTDLGRMMRAAAVNPRGSELASIPVERIQFGTYLAGGLLGGVAGIMILYSAGLDFTASLSLTLSGFGAAIIFGIDSPLRCLLGGIAMGVAESLAAGYTSGMVTAMVPFLFVLIVLSMSGFGAEAAAGDRP